MQTPRSSTTLLHGVSHRMASHYGESRVRWTTPLYALCARWSRKKKRKNGDEETQFRSVGRCLSDQKFGTSYVHYHELNMELYIQHVKNTFFRFVLGYFSRCLLLCNICCSTQYETLQPRDSFKRAIDNTVLSIIDNEPLKEKESVVFLFVK